MGGKKKNSHLGSGITKSPNRINPKGTKPSHDDFQRSKVKNKSSKGNVAVVYKITTLRLSPKPAETLQAKREWQNILNIMREEKIKWKVFYSTKFRYYGEIKSFTGKQQQKSSALPNQIYQKR